VGAVVVWGSFFDLIVFGRVGGFLFLLCFFFFCGGGSTLSISWPVLDDTASRNSSACLGYTLAYRLLPPGHGH